MLARYRTLVLPNVAWLGDESVAALTDYVKRGGGLVATYQSGRFDSDGNSRDNSRLAGLLGIRFQGEAKPVIGELRGVVQAYAKKSLDHRICATWDWFP